RLLEAFALYLIGMIVLSLIGRYVLKLDSLTGSALFLLLIPLALAWPAGKIGIHRTAVETGFTPGRGVVREVFMGIAGYLTGIPLIAVGFLTTLILSRWAHVQPTHPIIEMT